LRAYGRTQPIGYQVVTDPSPKPTEDAALVHVGRACVEPEPEGTENTRSTKIASNPSLTPS